MAIMYVGAHNDLVDTYDDLLAERKKKWLYIAVGAVGASAVFYLIRK